MGTLRSLFYVIFFLIANSKSWLGQTGCSWWMSSSHSAAAEFLRKGNQAWVLEASWFLRAEWQRFSFRDQECLFPCESRRQSPSLATGGSPCAGETRGPGRKLGLRAQNTI